MFLKIQNDFLINKNHIHAIFAEEDDDGTGWSVIGKTCISGHTEKTYKAKTYFYKKYELFRGSKKDCQDFIDVFYQTN